MHLRGHKSNVLTTLLKSRSFNNLVRHFQETWTKRANPLEDIGQRDRALVVFVWEKSAYDDSERVAVTSQFNELDTGLSFSTCWHWNCITICKRDGRNEGELLESRCLHMTAEAS